MPAVGAMRVRDSSELTRVSALELSVLVEKLAEFVAEFVGDFAEKLAEFVEKFAEFPE